MDVAFLCWWLSVLSKWEVGNKNQDLGFRKRENLSQRPEQAGLHSYQGGWRPLYRESAKNHNLEDAELPNAWGH